MLPGKSTIDQLFNGTRVFEIPFYQRSYVWGEKQWERLLSDIISVGQKTTDYFLGAIILKQIIAGTAKWGDYKVVIDGQQRLTTLAIFLKVLYLKQGGNEWFKRKFFLPDGTYAIQHSRIDRDDFQKVMQLESCDPIEGQSNIIKAYNYFIENLDPSTINENRLKLNIQVIDIIIDNNDDEQQIFDTINSLGVDLTTAELLKNHLFSEDTLSEYKSLWEPTFEKDEECIRFWAQPLLKGRNKQMNIEAFLNAFLQIKVHDPNLEVSWEDKLEYAKASALFYNYKNFIKTYYSSGHEFDFVKELVSYAKIYQETFSPDVVDCSLTHEAGIDRVNFLVFATDGTTMIPFIMYVIENVRDEHEQVKIFEYLESYIVRRLICRKSTKSYSDLFSEQLINANIRTVDDLIAYINEKDVSNNLAMPNNAELLRCCKEIEHPNYRGLAILYLLESKMRNSSLLTTQLLKYSSYTLEHLMPQKWVANWPLPANVDGEVRSHMIKTLGNFTMITQPLNSTISNEAWNVKLSGKNNKGGLKDYASGLLTLSNVLASTTWDEQSIENRSTWLAGQAARIWPSCLPGDASL